MAKKDVIRQAAQAAGVTQAVAGKVLEAAVDAISAAIIAGEPVKIQGLGAFTQKTRSGRTIREFKTGKPIVVQPSKTVCFTAYEKLKKQL